MGVRKNLLALNDTEKDNFFQALLMLKAEIVNPVAPAADQLSTYDIYAGYHQAIFGVTTPGETSLVNGGHSGPAFGPWHRELLIRFELDLQRMVPGVMLPYWDWTDHAGSEALVFSDDYFGPDGGPGGVGGGTVRSGYFSFDAPGTGSNMSTPVPAWWPAGLAGWRISPLLEEGEGTWLRRTLGNNEAGAFPDPFNGLATQAQVNALMQRPDFEDGAAGYRFGIEVVNPFHNYVHRWVTGHMETGASPNDPIFFMHHCNIDRLWAMWQMDGHAGVAGYPAGNAWPTGHNLNDPMWPWVGGLAGYSVSINSTVIANFFDYSGDPERSPIDVLNHRDITIDIGGVVSQVGYSYDTEVVVGVSLDRSGSMTGTTPDPMTGAGSMSKWDAAKLGVSHFLQDCEAAYDAVEAYVVSGVQTFQGSGAGTYEQVFGIAPPYGLVKNGGTYSAVNFNAAIAAMNPSGATPLAGALIETEADLVRPPFSNLPVNDPRYLYMLTDGKRTSGPLMSSLAEPEFPDTTIFGMGFGVGGGWNGVDYATILDVTEKGRDVPPPPPVIDQVYHGENAGTINKFFTSSIAATIGYTPVVDPIYELFPGEHSMTPFQVTSADSAFFISVLGFDYVDKNWSVMLLGPDGKEYMGAVTSPVLITVRRANGKFSIFLNRNGASYREWVGGWYVMVTYKSKAKALGMVMYSPWQHLIPTGAPPVSGPVFTRAKLAPSKRIPQRLAQPTKGNFRQPAVGISFPADGEAASVAVDIYAKTRLFVDIDAGPTTHFAGQKLPVEVRIKTPAKSTFYDVMVTGRAISPGFSLGNILSGQKALATNARQKTTAKATEPFDELGFLAEFEKKNPEALKINDRQLKFEPRIKNATYATVIKETQHPGVYWISAKVDGMWQPANGPAERFNRIISRQVTVGIRVNEHTAKPTLFWIDSNRFVVRLFAGDELGNIAAARRMEAPQLLFRTEALVTIHEVGKDGWHELEVKLAGRSIKLDAMGSEVKGATLTCESGKDRKLDRSLENALMVKLGGATLRVKVPPFVGDEKAKKYYVAGAREAQRIPLDRKVALSSKEEALAIGFKSAGRAGKSTKGKKI